MKSFLTALLVGCVLVSAAPAKPRKPIPPRHTGATVQSPNAPATTGYSPTSPGPTTVRWQLPPGMTPEQYQKIQNGQGRYRKRRQTAPTNTTVYP